MVDARDKEHRQHELDRIAAFAAAQLGPEGRRALAEPSVQALILHHVRRGSCLEDACLCELHRLAGESPAVANEFLSLFWEEAYRAGDRVMSPLLRRYLDTGDLVQSVFGGVWQELQGIRFQSRPQFLAYLRQRMSWKASDHARRLQARRRREDRRVDYSWSGVGAGEAPGPASLLGEQEDWQRMVCILGRLPADDQELLRLHLKGMNTTELAEELGCSERQARRQLRRAIGKAQDLAAALDARDEDATLGLQDGDPRHA